MTTDQRIKMYEYILVSQLARKQALKELLVILGFLFALLIAVLVFVH